MALVRPPLLAIDRPRLEVADIFRIHGPSYRQSHALSGEQRKAMWCIENCRTEVLGGHVDVCTACGHGHPSYNSCRNRHCPKCQALAQAQWLEKRKKRILPTHYFHVVFTMPHELNPLFQSNPRAMYNLLFASASQTLLAFGRKNLGAQFGITAVLHTWSRDLQLHPHLHCIVTGGGLDVAQNRWVSTPEKFLFPVIAMAKVFRGKLLEHLCELRTDGKLSFEGASTHLADARSFQQLVDTLYKTNWNVYAKPPFGGPDQVFEYIGRYTHRVAISNARLVHIDEHEVRFRTRDGNHETLTPAVFIRRFLLHLLPHAFVKIRHYGLMASGNSTTRLEAARVLLLLAAASANGGRPPQGAAPAPEKPLQWEQLLKSLTGIDPFICPHCGSRDRIRVSIREWKRLIAPSSEGTDTS